MIRRDMDNTPEADMARRGINRLGNTCRRAIPQAVIRRAEEGPAFEHFSWDAELRLCRINTLLSCPPSRIDRDAACPGRVFWMMLLVPVRRPFPHIASHVIQTITIRREGAHGRRPLIAISHQVLPGKFSLPGVGHHLATRSEFIPPGIHGTLYSPACSTFPLRLGRQLFACPCRIRQDIFIGDMHHRMVSPPFQGTPWPPRILPVGSRHVYPPVARITQINAMR